ncbi:hypothetical protein [Crossiella cryophila]|uniref:Uncharacterized protein n=1 Tax=Crossiella cryophila TaxID=43355 RepID=A0A7W7CEI5_9PSEU|nr:hypothetical protein [Crossiella cryophila]MBB4678064.1 hypothetical protein [Crossiella cryophila]
MRNSVLIRTLTTAALGLGLLIPGAAAATAAPAPSTAAAVSIVGLPIAPPLRPGVESKTWKVADYIKAWETYHGRPMTADERENLARGCIGVTVVNLERGDVGNPPLGLSFGTFGKAREVQAALNEIIKSKPSAAQYAAAVRSHPLLSKLENVQRALPADLNTGELTAAIFSKRFYSKQNPNWTDEFAEKMYRANARGQVDMNSYRYVARPGYVNFDYGWYDENTRNWWHANHAEPGMKVYQSTFDYYSRDLLDFDRQVFTVAFAKKV